MNKSDLVKELATRSKVSQDVAKQLLDNLTSSIGDTVKNGDDVTLLGFGSFKHSVRKARTGRNPASGAQIDIPEKKTISFKPGKDLIAHVAGVKK